MKREFGVRLDNRRL
jgi:Ras-related protein Rab-8A